MYSFHNGSGWVGIFLPFVGKSLSAVSRHGNGRDSTSTVCTAKRNLSVCTLYAGEDFHQSEFLTAYVGNPRVLYVLLYPTYPTYTYVLYVGIHWIVESNTVELW